MARLEADVERFLKSGSRERILDGGGGGDGDEDGVWTDDVADDDVGEVKDGSEASAED